MTDNQIVAKYGAHKNLTKNALEKYVGRIKLETGFKPGKEIDRRCIYDPNKTWRVHIEGTYQKKPAMLRVENLILEHDEEAIREAFRRQAKGSGIRPPNTLLSKPFDKKKGFAFSIDERVNATPLFDPAADPQKAIKRFIPFYRGLKRTVERPFWENDNGNITSFSSKQADLWMKLAKEKDPKNLQKVLPIAMRLRGAMLHALPSGPLEFMHAHLCGSDVRVTKSGTFVVFANHFWSWRQPGYDLAFPIWHQWMSLPPNRRTPQAIQFITESWLKAIDQSLKKVVDPKNVRTLLLNRLFGSLLLDIPAKKNNENETEKTVETLRAACVAEAERLLKK